MSAVSHLIENHISCLITVIIIIISNFVLHDEQAGSQLKARRH